MLIGAGGTALAEDTAGTASTELDRIVSPHLNWVNSLKPNGHPDPPLKLAAGGRAFYSILLASKANAQEEKAATDLAHWLKRAAFKSREQHGVVWNGLG